AVLVVRASRASLHVDLIIVVFARVLIQGAKLQRVTFLDPGQAVGRLEDGAGGVRGIRPAAQVREGRHVHGRNTGRNQLSVRKYIGVVETCLCPIEKVRLVNGNQDDVLTGCKQDLVNLRGDGGP